MDKTQEAKRQIDKFREAARELETDDDEARFDQRLGKIAKAPPQKDSKNEADNKR
ncbi:hypothetical protein [Rhizobium straminoryzae]|uniref:hypothetical protein n=1 Tax=Rhizobium straminoryzae TaxID=1387186 RepID=UPI00163D703A|nr:hypothetical protein [Rhizobium straminoryzae]